MIFYAKRIFYPEDILCLYGLPVDVYLVCKRTSLLGRGQTKYTATEDLHRKDSKREDHKDHFDLILTHDFSGETNKQEKISDALHEEVHRRMYVVLNVGMGNQVCLRPDSADSIAYYQTIYEQTQGVSSSPHRVHLFLAVEQTEPSDVQFPASTLI